MSAAYKAIGWNRSKIIYDCVAMAGVAVWLTLFLRVAPALSPAVAAIDSQIRSMRAYGSLAFVLVTIILSIGPLARLDPRFLPVLYNRRHLGVLAAMVALCHAWAVIGWYFNYSPTPPLLALLTSNTSFERIAGFPFETLGIAALIVLVVMAVTSHDFWLSFLTPPVWKAIHMAIYPAYAAIILHIFLGPAAAGRDPVLLTIAAIGAAVVTTLHVVTGRREAACDALGSVSPEAGWIEVGDAARIAEARAVIGLLPDGERVAVFRSKNRLVAVSNVCSHQNGPIGEGRVVDGFITCPWHGYQYRPEDGCSPPPFTERIKRYPLKIVDGRVWVASQAAPLGTKLEPVAFSAGIAADQTSAAGSGA